MSPLASDGAPKGSSIVSLRETSTLVAGPLRPGEAGCIAAVDHIRNCREAPILVGNGALRIGT